MAIKKTRLRNRRMTQQFELLKCGSSRGAYVRTPAMSGRGRRFGEPGVRFDPVVGTVHGDGKNDSTRTSRQSNALAGAELLNCRGQMDCTAQRSSGMPRWTCAVNPTLR